MMSALIVQSALDYVEFTSVMAFIVLLGCALISYQVSVRRPLYYNLFVVEMHTWTTRRMVQVLHLGQEFQPSVQWDRLVQRMRARAPRAEGEQRIAISDTNIVIQSPNTVIDSPAPARSPNVDVITLWDIEMPAPASGHVPDAARDSQYAAAAAIAILARGDDASLLSRVFQPPQEQSSTGNVSPATDGTQASTSQENLPTRRHHDYVTTDVTYTTPSVSSDLHHQISTRMSDVTQSSGPRNETISVGNENSESEDESSGEESVDDSEESETSETASVEINEDIDTSGTSWPGASTSTQQSSACSCSKKAAPSTADAPEQSTEEPEKSLIRLKFMNDTERDTYASLEDTVAKFKQDNFTDLNDQTVRLIFQGQLLRDDFRTLQQYGLQSGSVIHCHISNVPYNNNATSQPTPAPITRASAIRDLFFSRREPLIPTRSAEPAEGSEETTNADGEAEAPAEPTNRDLQLEMEIRSDRNVGQLFLLLSTLVPILSGLGLAFFRPERLRDAFRPTTLMTVSHWMINLFTEFGLMDEDEDENTMHTVLIFIICAVSLFLYFTPSLFDRVEYYIAFAVLFYIVFHLYARYRRRHPEPEAHEDLNENQIIQENISLL